MLSVQADANEISQEMIDAGVRALADSCFCNDFGATYTETVISVYLAMAAGDGRAYSLHSSV